MKVVVTTPAGHVGSRVAQLLIQAGVRPTSDLARIPDDAPEILTGCRADQPLGRPGWSRYAH